MKEAIERACRNCKEEFTPSRFDLKRRTCRPCQVVVSRLRTARRARSRKRDYARPPIRDWRKARKSSTTKGCAVCGTRQARQHVDHIVPAGLLRYLAEVHPPSMPRTVENAEDPRNLLGICAACHGRKTAAEVVLCAGKPMDFWRRLERLDWPMDRVRLALALYGLDAGLGKAGF